MLAPFLSDLKCGQVSFGSPTVFLLYGRYMMAGAGIITSRCANLDCATAMVANPGTCMLYGRVHGCIKVLMHMYKQLLVSVAVC